MPTPEYEEQAAETQASITSCMEGVVEAMMINPVSPKKKSRRRRPSSSDSPISNSKVLGPKRFSYGYTTYIREDLAIQGQSTESYVSEPTTTYAWWWRQRNRTKGELEPCVLYCSAAAGVAGAKEARKALCPLLAAGLSVMALDLWSYGAPLTLGVGERQHIANALFFLKERGVTEVTLWGHGAGASTVLWYMSSAGDNWEKDCMPPILGAVLESPLPSFESMLVEALEIAEAAHVSQGGSTFTRNPSLLHAAVRVLHTDITNHFGVNAFDLRPNSAAVHCDLPCLLAYGSAEAAGPNEVSAAYGGQLTEVHLDHGRDAAHRSLVREAVAFVSELLKAREKAKAEAEADGVAGQLDVQEHPPLSKKEGVRCRLAKIMKRKPKRKLSPSRTTTAGLASHPGFNLAVGAGHASSGDLPTLSALAVEVRYISQQLQGGDLGSDACKALIEPGPLGPLDPLNESDEAKRVEQRASEEELWDYDDLCPPSPSVVMNTSGVSAIFDLEDMEQTDRLPTRLFTDHPEDSIWVQDDKLSQDLQLPRTGSAATQILEYTGTGRHASFLSDEGLTLEDDSEAKHGGEEGRQKSRQRHHKPKAQVSLLAQAAAARGMESSKGMEQARQRKPSLDSLESSESTATDDLDQFSCSPPSHMAPKPPHSTATSGCGGLAECDAPAHPHLVDEQESPHIMVKCLDTG
ncbi:unnamed protein product [Chrysoparadoxa australica]